MKITWNCRPWTPTMCPKKLWPYSASFLPVKTMEITWNRRPDDRRSWPYSASFLPVKPWKLREIAAQSIVAVFCKLSAGKNHGNYVKSPPSLSWPYSLSAGKNHGNYVKSPSFSPAKARPSTSTFVAVISVEITWNRHHILQRNCGLVLLAFCRKISGNYGEIVAKHLNIPQTKKSP